MKWSILIASARPQKLAALMNSLNAQIKKYEDIEIVALVDNLKRNVGQKRTELVELAQGEYISFIDDDDQVPEDYVESIYPLLDGVDYVGFKLQHYHNGNKSKPTFHSLRYTSWDQDNDGFYRHLSHLNPIKRELARLVPFVGKFGEDFDWANKLYATGKVQTEHYIDRTMYHYFYNSEETLSGNA